MDRQSQVCVCVFVGEDRGRDVHLHVYMGLCLDAWRICICIWLLSFWPVCPNLADRKLSNVDYFEVESFDLLKSLLWSVQANARVLQGQLLSLSMLLLLPLLFSLHSLCFSPSPLPFSASSPLFLPPILPLPLPSFLPYIMTWTMSWQHKEPSDFVSMLTPFCHRQCVEHVGVVWFNKTGFRHCWLTDQNTDVFYEQTTDSYVGLIRVNSPSKKCP